MTGKGKGKRRSKKSEATGDCFEAAGQYMMDAGISGNHKLRLVHGEVRGRGKLQGVQFAHAWILDGDTVIDPSGGNVIELPRFVYYALGNIDDIGNTHEYTYLQMIRKINEHKHWGPWDLVTSSGL